MAAGETQLCISDDFSRASDVVINVLTALYHSQAVHWFSPPAVRLCDRAKLLFWCTVGDPSERLLYTVENIESESIHRWRLTAEPSALMEKIDAQLNVNLRESGQCSV